MTDAQLLDEARKWLIGGGAGHEDGEAGLRAVTWSGEAVVEALAEFAASCLAGKDEEIERLKKRVEIEIRTRNEAADKWDAAERELAELKAENAQLQDELKGAVTMLRDCRKKP